MAFRGHYEYSLDAKNRLNLPPRFRAAFSGGLVLQKWIEPCVAVWAPETFDEFTQSFLADLNPVSPERIRLTRYFAGNSFDVELDASGRVTLPQPLLEHAGISKEVAVVGNLDHLEVWDRERWVEHERELSAGIADIAGSLGHPS